MRVVDDRIDNLPSRSGLTPRARGKEREIVDAWREGVSAVYRGQSDELPALAEATECPHATALFEALRSALHNFPVPQGLWNNFFAAMLQDLERSRFKTYQEFLDYAEGATVAPTTIYLYLLSAQPGSGSRYAPPPGFDLIRCGRALGLFAYLGHILRDLPEDLEHSGESLLYLAADDMRSHHLTEAMLFADLKAGRGSRALRALATTLVRRARAFLAEGRQHLTPLQGRLPSDCAYILNLILAIYEAVLGKIEACGNDPMQRRHRLTEDEKQAIAARLLVERPRQRSSPHPSGSFG